MSVYRHFGRICTCFSNLRNCLSFNARVPIRASDPKLFGTSIIFSNKFHATSRRNDLMEFFDSKENWGADEVKVGRAWKLDELRIKSNSDLHKLWFVLLKEKNMLLTMEHEYKEKTLPMPNPERIHKVNESMENLEKIVRERNKAYYMLETGETGEQDIVDDHNVFGLPFKRKLKEHYVDKKFNVEYKKHAIARHRMVFDPDVVSFLKKYNEKQRRIKNYKAWMKYKYVCGLIKRFEGIDEEALKAEFPDVDIEEAKKDPMSRGPRFNLY